MREGFTSLSVAQLASATQQLADIQFQQYIAANPGFASAQVTNAMNIIKPDKINAYSSAMDAVTGVDNSLTSTIDYYARTDSLQNLATNIQNATADQISASTVNAGLVKRQAEINEWSNFNKLDTLYFMQLMFIILTFIIIFSFLKTNGFISNALFILLSSVLGIIAIIVLILRARFTNINRDSRYWHKNRFPSEAGSSNNSKDVNMQIYAKKALEQTKSLTTGCLARICTDTEVNTFIKSPAGSLVYIQKLTSNGIPSKIDDLTPLLAAQGLSSSEITTALNSSGIKA